MNYIERMLETANLESLLIKRLGLEAVAEKSGLTKRVVNKFCTDPLKSKNADIKKIRDALAELAPEDVAKIKEETK
ncbi:hypothetical protein [Actinomycetia phage DSL-LC01]|nr:hypothetical protein [Actinomycetia phage DSL-LC01]